MLEHADRNDAVVATRLLAIIEKLEADLVRDALVDGAAARNAVLLAL